MKIAFSAENDSGLDSRLSPHFGRCPYYVFVEVESGEAVAVETRKNPYFDSHEHGVVPRYIAGENVNVMISGGMGPRAIEWFRQFNVEVVTGASGMVKDVLNDYLEGRLSGDDSCGEHGH